MNGKWEGRGGLLLALLIGMVSLWQPRQAGLAVAYALQAYVLLSCLHLFGPVLVLVLAYPRLRRRFAASVPVPTAPATAFVLLIPAHNEARLLPALLRSIRQQHYPAALCTVVVVADNCHDATAALARHHGACCLERHTTHPSDKTQALQYAAAHLPLLAGSQAVVCILDADCKLERHYLAALDQVFRQPGAAPVVQTYRYVSNTFASAVATLDAAAEALRQWVLSGTRQLLGLDSFVYGLGCALRADVLLELLQLPDYTLAEDKDWNAHLLRRGLRVAFCPTARLCYEVVETSGRFQQQRRRWLAGHWQALRRHALPMLRLGVGQARLAPLDFAGQLLQLPRSGLLLAALGLGGLALGWPRAALLPPLGWGALVVAFFLYGMLGLWLIKAPRQQYLLLFSGVRLVLGVAKTLLLLLLGRGIRIWEATRKPHT